VEDCLGTEVTGRDIRAGTVAEDLLHPAPGVPGTVADELPLERFLHPPGTKRFPAGRAQDEEMLLQVVGGSDIGGTPDDVYHGDARGNGIAAVLAPPTDRTDEPLYCGRVVGQMVGEQGHTGILIDRERSADLAEGVPPGYSPDERVTGEHPLHRSLQGNTVRGRERLREINLSLR